MVDLQRLNTIIDELDMNTRTFSAIKDIIETINDTTITIDKSVDNMRQVMSVTKDLNASNADIQKSIEQSSERLDENFRQMHLKQSQFIGEINTLLLEIKNEAHELNKQLESAIVSKLDLLKSDILLENRENISKLQNHIDAKIVDSQEQVINTIIPTVQTSQKTIIGRAEALFSDAEQKENDRFGLIKKMAIGLGSITIITLILSIIKLILLLK